MTPPGLVWLFVQFIAEMLSNVKRMSNGEPKLTIGGSYSIYNDLKGLCKLC
jgi:hypothetical protein